MHPWDVQQTAGHWQMPLAECCGHVYNSTKTTRIGILFSCCVIGGNGNYIGGVGCAKKRFLQFPSGPLPRSGLHGHLKAPGKRPILGKERVHARWERSLKVLSKYELSSHGTAALLRSLFSLLSSAPASLSSLSSVPSSLSSSKLETIQVGTFLCLERALFLASL